MGHVILLATTAIVKQQKLCDQCRPLKNATLSQTENISFNKVHETVNGKTEMQRWKRGMRTARQTLWRIWNSCYGRKWFLLLPSFSFLRLPSPSFSCSSSSSFFSSFFSPLSLLLLISSAVECVTQQKTPEAELLRKNATRPRPHFIINIHRVISGPIRGFLWSWVPIKAQLAGSSI